jgi:hydroxyacylglutathione hydrolase
MKTIGMLDMKNLLGKLGEGEIILDVRGAEEFKGGHLPGARNIPHDQVAQHAAELGKFRTVYVHCQAGKRAGMAADALSKLGLTNIVCVSGGGMGDWIAAGLPVER